MPYVHTRDALISEKEIDRFYGKVAVGRAPSECQLWNAGLNQFGYGQFWLRGTNVGPHRVAYELWKGPIPPGLQIDHLCRNRRCVNVEHLEATTPKVNTLRSLAPSAVNAIKAHCKRGHAFTPENTRIRRKGQAVERHCRVCVRAGVADHYRRKRASGLIVGSEV